MTSDQAEEYEVMARYFRRASTLYGHNVDPRYATPIYDAEAMLRALGCDDHANQLIAAVTAVTVEQDHSIALANEEANNLRRERNRTISALAVVLPIVVVVVTVLLTK